MNTQITLELYPLEAQEATPKYKTVMYYAYNGRAWVAEIDGLDGKYGLSRNFLQKKDVSMGSNKYRDIEIMVKLTEGTIYEWSSKESSSRTERGFWVVKNGELVDIDKTEVIELLS